MEDRPLNGVDSLYSVTEAEVKMPMDGLQRSYVDDVAEEYGVELEYDEGSVNIRGINNEQVREFVSEVYNREKSMEGKDHPDEFGFPESDPFSALEKDGETKEGKVMTDGGENRIDPSRNDPRYNEDRQPYIEDNGEFGPILTGE